MMRATTRGSASTKSDADIERIADAMSRLRLMTRKHIVGRMALREAAPGLELADLDVLDAVKQVSRDGEVTVGAVAEAMCVDPSRASRLVSDLVQRGVLKRAVSQADARRAVVELADKACSYFQEKELAHRTLIQSITQDWAESDVERFSKLFLCFIDKLESVAKDS